MKHVELAEMIEERNMAWTLLGPGRPRTGPDGPRTPTVREGSPCGKEIRAGRAGTARTAGTARKGRNSTESRPPDI